MKPLTCAAVTRRPMPASVLPAPVVVARSESGASYTTVPAVTCLAARVCVWARLLNKATGHAQHRAARITTLVVGKLENQFLFAHQQQVAQHALKTLTPSSVGHSQQVREACKLQSVLQV